MLTIFTFYFVKVIRLAFCDFSLVYQLFCYNFYILILYQILVDFYLILNVYKSYVFHVHSQIYKKISNSLPILFQLFPIISLVLIYFIDLYCWLKLSFLKCLQHTFQQRESRKYSYTASLLTLEVVRHSQFHFGVSPFL